MAMHDGANKNATNSTEGGVCVDDKPKRAPRKKAEPVYDSFSITLLFGTGKNDSHYSCAKVIAPSITITGPEGCNRTKAVEEFFRSQKGCHVKRTNTNAGTRRGAQQQEKSTAHGQPCEVTVDINGQPHTVPMPRLESGVKEETIRKRLVREFSHDGIKPRAHQKDLINALSTRNFEERNTPAFMVYWTMGSGKTDGTCYLLCEKRSKRNVILCSITNIEHWFGCFRRTSVPHRPGEKNTVMLFDIVGYTAFRTDYDDCRAMRSVSCVVVDEAHCFRNSTREMQSAMQCVRSAKNVLLLTGTPMVNDVEDVIGMVELMDMDGEHDLDDGGVPSTAEVARIFKGNVSYFDPRVHCPNMYKKHYPETEDVVVRVPMTFMQTIQYMMALQSRFELGPFVIQQGRSNRYNALTRAVCNAPEGDPEGSPKLRAVADAIVRNKPEGPQVVHSSLVETGVKPLFDMLRKRGEKLKMTIMTGETDNSKRNTIRTDYNKGKTDVLMISDASQEGTDLMNTANILLIEPFPNMSLYNQTRSRVIRMGSHRKAKAKKVRCTQYISVFPDKITDSDVKAGREFIVAKRLLGPRTADLLEEVDLKDEIQRKIAEQGGKTINEKQMESNVVKQRAIDPYLAAIQSASVRMTTQRCVDMFSNMAGDNNGEGGVCVGAGEKNPNNSTKRAAKHAKSGKKRKAGDNKDGQATPKKRKTGVDGKAKAVGGKHPKDKNKREKGPKAVDPGTKKRKVQKKNKETAEPARK